MLHGIYLSSDAQGCRKGQNLFTVRFKAEQLWGKSIVGSAVYVDLCEPYLEPMWGMLDLKHSVGNTLASQLRDSDAPVLRQSWEARAFEPTIQVYERGPLS